MGEKINKKMPEGMLYYRSETVMFVPGISQETRRRKTSEKKMEKKQAMFEKIKQEPQVQEAIEQLRHEKSIGAFFDGVNNLAIETYFNSENPLFREMRSNLEKNIRPEHVERTIKLQDFSTAEPTEEKYTSLFKTLLLKEQLAREFVRELVKEENNLGLTETEKIVLLGSCDMADAYDDFTLAWHKNMILSPLSKRLATMSPDEAKKFLQEKGALEDLAKFGPDLYLYNIFEENVDGTIANIPYATAFKKETEGIVRAMDTIINQLADKTDAESIALKDYYEALKTAQSATTTDIAEQNELQTDVDKKWMKIKGRMQPIHMMESYVDPLGLRVEPEYSISFEDDRYQHVNNTSDETKAHMLSYLKNRFSDKETLHPLFPAMEASTAKAYTMLTSGKRLIFRPAAENIPNRASVRQTEGVKIFFDMLTFKQRWQMQEPILNKLLGPEEVQRLFTPTELYIDDFAATFVAGHEIAHNAFILPETRSKMGAKTVNEVEENKSDMTIMASQGENKVSNDQIKIIKGLFSFDARTLARTDESSKPYFNSAVIMFQKMLDHKIAIPIEGEYPYKLDLTPEKAKAYIADIQLIHDELVDAYDSLSQPKAEQFMGQYYVATPEMNRLLNIVREK